MITRNKTSLLLAALVAATFSTTGIAEAGKPTIAGGCKKCHTAQPEAVRGGHDQGVQSAQKKSLKYDHIKNLQTMHAN